MPNPLSEVHGKLLVVRAPVPATCNKAGANYKSEVTHLIYSPRRAYDEWLSICEGILACGGDALVRFEPEDEPFLDRGPLHCRADGSIVTGPGELVGHMDAVETGRVFTANGPWVVVTDGVLRAVMPHMLPHRRSEASYYRQLLAQVAAESGHRLELVDNPHRWEGMADVAVVGDRAVLTYAVPGHYDEGTASKSQRSSGEGVSFAADAVGVPADARIYAELVYPHFHGDTVHFGARPVSRPPLLVHYPGGLWGSGSASVREALGGAILPIGRDDAVDQYAGNSRQVVDGVLVPDGVSEAFAGALGALGLQVHRVPLFELFGKAGGGPACATLYLPANLQLPPDSPLRYSVIREQARARRERIPERLEVDAGYFAGKRRG